MPQFIIRSDHTVRVFPAVAVGDALWCARAVLTLTKTDRVVEATSAPCQTPQAASEAALVLARQVAGFSS
jgi:hypothetical protein